MMMPDEHLVLRALMRRVGAYRVRVERDALMNTPLKCELIMTQDHEGFWLELKNDAPLPEVGPRPPQNWLEGMARLGVSLARIGSIIVLAAAVVRLTVLCVEYIWTLGGVCG